MDWMDHMVPTLFFPPIAIWDSPPELFLFSTPSVSHQVGYGWAQCMRLVPVPSQSLFASSFTASSFAAEVWIPNRHKVSASGNCRWTHQTIVARRCRPSQRSYSLALACSIRRWMGAKRRDVGRWCRDRR
eukprot:scaffold164020_cov80-Attheya_sp.AAC.3